ncbi:MAG: hypothetical protein LC657_17480, partial [Desulfobacteraceae bacterium]|nr:hypothetical protein [Desulfobacteraceae bacterium]
YSRESRQGRPWMEIETAGRDDAGPGVVDAVQVNTQGMGPGQAVLSWITPEDAGGSGVLGFDVSWAGRDASGDFPRYLIPMASASGPGRSVDMHIRDIVEM